MAELNLPPRTRRTLNELVAACDQAGADEFHWAGGYSTADTIVVGERGDGPTVTGDIGDIRRLARLGLVSIEGGDDGVLGCLLPRGRQAVSANFALPDPPPGVVIAQQFNAAIHGGQFNAAAGPGSRASMHVIAGASADHAALTAELGRLTAALTEMVRATLPAAAADAVVAAAESAKSEASRPDPSIAAVSGETGATLTSLLKAITLAGSASVGAEQLAQLMSDFAAWAYGCGMAMMVRADR